MSDTQFIIRFHHRDSSVEELIRGTAADAWSDFRLFIEPDSAEIYSRIELLEYNFYEAVMYPLADITFND